MTGIYKITNPKGKIYIGQSVNIENRKYQYKYSYKNNKQTHLGPKLYNSFIKYGFDEHLFEIIEECSIELLNERETFYKLQVLNDFNNDWSKVLFCELYDLGGGPKSQLIKNKISKSNMNKIVSDETRIKMSVSGLGRKRSQETKDKISKANKGKKKSESHIKNMMNNRDNLIKGVILKNSKPIKQFDLNMKLLKNWDSITKAKKWLGKGDINGCLMGRQKTAGGYIWEYE